MVKRLISILFPIIKFLLNPPIISHLSVAQNLPFILISIWSLIIKLFKRQAKYIWLSSEVAYIIDPYQGYKIWIKPKDRGLSLDIKLLSKCYNTNLLILWTIYLILSFQITQELYFDNRKWFCNFKFL